MAFRLTDTQFNDDFEPAWDNQAIRDDDTSEQDGRAYYYSIESSLVDTSDSGLVEYLDYPYCELRDYDATTGTSTTGSDASLYWYCQIYLTKDEYQTDGYPTMASPGVIAGYYVASYLPTFSYLSYFKAEQVIESYSGAYTLTASFAAIAAAFAVAF